MYDLPPGFDWKNPDYTPIFNARMKRLAWIREDPKARIPPLKAFYAENPGCFIHDWGVTFDPRNADLGRPVKVPFLLFPKQQEWIAWVLESWRNRRSGVSVKSRDGGLSWLAVSLSATLCLHHKDLNIGFGSRKLELVDKLGDPDCLFWKARAFMENLPPEFRGGWDRRKHGPEKLLIFPETGSTMKGEGGDEIGRGGRSSLYMVDEAASLEHPQLADAALSATTNCRMDISTPKGMGNPFHLKVTTWPAERVFQFHWRDDPRKDEAWYQKMLEDFDALIVAQEIDMDFAASVEGVLIPSAWVQASIDAHLKLGIAPTGERRGGLDIADEGRDTNAYAGVNGWLLEYLDEWSGKGDDIFGTVVRAFGITDELGYAGFKFDSDGLGAGARGDARVINQQRREQGRHQLTVTPFRGSESVFDPEGYVDPRDAKNPDPLRARRNKDFFANRKAQAWWELRRRFQATFRAVSESAPYNPDDLISISSAIPLRAKLAMELSQPTYSLNLAGKVVVDKVPDGTKSPNLADAVMIAYSRASREPLRINPNALGAI